MQMQQRQVETHTRRVRRRVCSWWSTADDGLLRTLMLALVALVVLQIASRRVLVTPIPWTAELSRFTMIWLTFWGAASCVRTNRHVSFDALRRRARRGSFLRLVLDGFVLVCTACLMAAILVLGIEWSISVAQSGQGAVTFDLPIFVVGLVIPVSALASLIYVGIEGWKTCRRKWGESDG